MEPVEASSVVWLKIMWRETKCFWSWPFGHRWISAGGYTKECAVCHTWRAW